MSRLRLRRALFLFMLLLGSTALVGACTPTVTHRTSGCPAGQQDPAGPVYYGVAYGSQPLQTANIYPACTSQAVGTLMYVHGGGYTSGDRFEAEWPWISRLRSTGWVIVSIDYRLAPIDGWPDQPNDVQAAINWWRSTGAGEFAAPASPLVGVGWSAGGQLAEWNNVQDYTNGFDAAVSVSGSTYWPDRIGATATKALFGLTPSNSTLVDASTVTHLDPGDPPLLHIHAENDTTVPISQATLLQSTIDTNGDPTKHQVVTDPTCGHSLACLTPERIDPFLASIAAG